MTQHGSIELTLNKDKERSGAVSANPTLYCTTWSNVARARSVRARSMSGFACLKECRARKPCMRAKVRANQQATKARSESTPNPARRVLHNTLKRPLSSMKEKAPRLKRRLRSMIAPKHDSTSELRTRTPLMIADSKCRLHRVLGFLVRLPTSCCVEGLLLHKHLGQRS